jgi:hypothetical protein
MEQKRYGLRILVGLSLLIYLNLFCVASSQIPFKGKQVRDGVFRGKPTRFVDGEVSVRLRTSTSAAQLDNLLAVIQHRDGIP